MESFQFIDPSDQLFQQTSGKILHQFIMVTVHLRTDRPGQLLWTYFRVDFDNNPYPSGRHIVGLSDDHEGLRGHSRGLGRLSGADQPVENGPSLDDIASLLEVVHHRRMLRGYNGFCRDSLWLTENLLLSTARKYSQHWLAGPSKPEALRTYAEYMILYDQDPVTQSLVGMGTRPVRHPDRIKLHDEDVRIILEEWIPSTKAGFI
ncbi:uncharacterized protein C8Q71DRAFT_512771 [Rhodofomes roseus]|uniref:Uncharacterized protein n=1 Tax=Rhodofomes roseus TaxID=34475 RepID=A0ABQ8KNX7_9APHY|nr:uncharacterized protein C8Q71DRAFT_512771 [Rhodofomes roseus]KAH9839452.1 hypothetical protein C8Q71DRAFT_512771 [Rhodofomes roseus]